MDSGKELLTCVCVCVCVCVCDLVYTSCNHNHSLYRGYGRVNRENPNSVKKFVTKLMKITKRPIWKGPS